MPEFSQPPGRLIAALDERRQTVPKLSGHGACRYARIARCAVCADHHPALHKSSSRSFGTSPPYLSKTSRAAAVLVALAADGGRHRQGLSPTQFLTKADVPQAEHFSFAEVGLLVGMSPRWPQAGQVASRDVESDFTATASDRAPGACARRRDRASGWRYGHSSKAPNSSPAPSLASVPPKLRGSFSPNLWGVASPSTCGGCQSSSIPLGLGGLPAIISTER